MTTAAPQAESSNPDAPLLEVRDLKKHFPITKGLLLSRITGHLKAVDGISFQIDRGKALGIVGESGCGKSTTAKLLLMLEAPTEGNILFEGEDIHHTDSAHRRAYRSSVQAVFQDPWSSLNPRMRVRDLIAEPMVINWDVPKREIQERVAELLRQVGLNSYHANLYPHEFSGGQRQRLAIARGMSPESQDDCAGRAGFRFGCFHPRPDNEPAQGLAK